RLEAVVAHHHPERLVEHGDPAGEYLGDGLQLIDALEEEFNARAGCDLVGWGAGGRNWPIEDHWVEGTGPLAPTRRCTHDFTDSQRPDDSMRAKRKLFGAAQPAAPQIRPRLAVVLSVELSHRHRLDSAGLGRRFGGRLGFSLRSRSRLGTLG